MMLSFGEALRELRRKAKVSQRELAKRIGVDFTYISKIENGHLSSPSADTTVAICRALNLPEDKLLALIGKIPSNIEKTIATSEAAQEFLRNVESMNLTEYEWKRIRESLKYLRDTK